MAINVRYVLTVFAGVPDQYGVGVLQVSTAASGGARTGARVHH